LTTRKTILLYGATGYSGALIAAEGARRGMSSKGNSACAMTLAARNGRRLLAVADEHGMNRRAFGLDSTAHLMAELEQFDVVINAAGPFVSTALPLATAALQARCHYVDINAELDVYRELDDLALKAQQRGIALVSGAGTSAAASNLLLDFALDRLARNGRAQANGILGAVRIAAAQFADVSRGSALTALRLARTQVAVVREGLVRDSGGRLRRQSVVSHEPVGRLERMFDLGPHGGRGSESNERRPLCVASAANMIDTLAAKHRIESRNLKADTIESYLEMGTLNRLAYQFAGMFSPFAAFPLVSAAVSAPLRLLPDGPTRSERLRQGHVIALQIEGPYRERIVDWRWETPNAYQFTAQLVVAVAFGLAVPQALTGWVTPAAALRAGGFCNLRQAVRGCVRRPAG
jgi:short subunit dehydrogenase-like uncharacterized protein